MINKEAIKMASLMMKAHFGEPPDFTTIDNKFIMPYNTIFNLYYTHYALLLETKGKGSIPSSCILNGNVMEGLAQWHQILELTKSDIEYISGFFEHMLPHIENSDHVYNILLAIQDKILYDLPVEAGTAKRLMTRASKLFKPKYNIINGLYNYLS